MRLRLFSSRLAARHRRIYQGVLAFFVVVFVAMIWPVVTVFSRVEPMILGLPFFLLYLAALLLSSFFVLLALFLWEGRTGSSGDPGEESS